jgi:hypothetical protein
MHTRTLAIVVLLLVAASAPAAAQTEQWVPYTLTAEQTTVRVWTSGANTFARVNLVFPTGGYRVAETGPVVRQDNNFSVDFRVERWTGGTTQALTFSVHTFDLGAIGAETGAFTFTVTSSGASVRSVTFVPANVVERWEETSLERNRVAFAVWTVGRVTFARVGLIFPDESYRVVSWGPLVRAGNDFTTNIRLERSTSRAGSGGATSEERVFTLGELPLQETFTVSAQFSDGVRHTSAPFTPEQQRVAGNMSDEPAFFVRQHYLDFLELRSRPHARRGRGVAEARAERPLHGLRGGRGRPRAVGLRVLPGADCDDRSRPAAADHLDAAGKGDAAAEAAAGSKPPRGRSHAAPPAGAGASQDGAGVRGARAAQPVRRMDRPRDLGRRRCRPGVALLDSPGLQPRRLTCRRSPSAGRRSSGPTRGSRSAFAA